VSTPPGSGAERPASDHAQPSALPRSFVVGVRSGLLDRSAVVVALLLHPGATASEALEVFCAFDVLPSSILLHAATRLAQESPPLGSRTSRPWWSARRPEFSLMGLRTT